MGTPKSPTTTCPSKICWKLTTKGCKLKNKKSCNLQVKCSPTHLQATFPEGIFDLTEVDKESECLPKLIKGIWHWNVQLGKCDMQIEKLNHLKKE